MPATTRAETATRAEETTRADVAARPEEATRAQARRSLTGAGWGLPSRPGESAGPASRGARALLHALVRRGAGGTLVVIDAKGAHELGSGAPRTEVTVHDDRAYTAILLRGSVGLGESYTAGWWDADDVTAVVRLLERRFDPLLARLDHMAGRFHVPDGIARRQAPKRADDKRNIVAHYDVSNDFYAAMLDATMSYSCAVFEAPGMSLRDAQEAKIDRLCRKLRLDAGDHLVEIGTGWGGLAVHAASRYGCRVTTTTISDEQRIYAEKLVAANGLSDRITVLGSDWRDLTGSYSRLVSVEMIEAVDWRHHDAFLRRCADLLQLDGLAVIQAITIEERSFERAKRHSDFVNAMVFPGSCLPSVSSLTSSLGRATNLRIVDLEDIGQHYAATLRSWRENLAANKQKVADLGLPRAFHRLWHMYLCYCEAAFLEGHVSDVQLVLARPRWAPASGQRPL